MSLPFPAASSCHTTTCTGRGLLSGLVAATIGLASPALADQVTYAFSGTIEDLVDPSDVTGGATTFSLHATYDTDAPDEASSDPEVGMYRLTSLTLRAGEYSKSFFVGAAWYVFEAEDGNTWDSLYLHAQNGLLMQLTDLEGSVFGSSALPQTLPNVSDFELRDLSFSELDGEWFEFQGTVASIETETAPQSPCPEDVNADGNIDFTDLFAVLSAAAVCAGCPEDVDQSGAVDFADVLSVLVAWGTCTN